MFENALPAASRKLLQDFNDEINRLEFYLAGGSGLALQLGHRVSEDMDFFTPKDFRPEALARFLETRTHYRETMVSPGTLYCDLNDVKVSFIYYPIPLVYSPLVFQKMRLADWRDIMAEKFKTLSQRGSRKDFYDIYACFTINKLSIQEGSSIFRKRFAGTGINYYHILKSLAYFQEADKEPELILLKPIQWRSVKDFFLKNLKQFEKYLLIEE